jgi:hypothetical protein
MQSRFAPMLSFALRFLLMFAIVLVCMSAASFAQIAVGVAVSFAPPPIPVYDQPLCPGDGYIWTPGYWDYDSDIDDYYWVPGTWVLAPEVGFLWTPGWWGWGDGGFFFHDGYWGPLVGFYGGINYGFGYFGTGFVGGRWDHDHFFYNRAVMNVNVTEIHNVYNETVVVNNTHVSYNGGEGGINRRPTPEEEAAARDRHVPPVAAQVQHVQAARSNPQLRASANMGKPPIAATPRPGDLNHGVQAKEPGGHYTPPANHGGNRPAGNAAAARNENAAPRPENNAERPSTATHVRELPPAERPAAPNTGNAKQDQKYQQQQEKLYTQQQKERQTVTQQQEKEDQTLAKQNASEAQKQQQEQRHQQQTQQLQQRHQQQQQRMQQRMQPRPEPKSKPPK